MGLKFRIFNVGEANFIAAVDGSHMVVLDAGRDLNGGGGKKIFETPYELGTNGSVFRRLLPNVKNIRMVISHQDTDHFNLLGHLFSDIEKENETRSNPAYKINVDQIYIGGNNPKSNVGILPFLKKSADKYGNDLNVNFIGTKNNKNQADHWVFRKGNPPTCTQLESTKDIYFNFGTGSKLTIVVPKKFYPEASPWGRNGKSLVTLVQSNGRKMLFPGDATTDVLEGIKKRYTEEFFHNIDTIVLPHHSANTGQNKIIRGTKRIDEGQTVEWLKSIIVGNGNTVPNILVFSSERRKSIKDNTKTVLPSRATIWKNRIQKEAFSDDGQQLADGILPGAALYRTRNLVVPASYDVDIDSTGDISLSENDYLEEKKPILSIQNLPGRLSDSSLQDLVEEAVYKQPLEKRKKFNEIMEKLYDDRTIGFQAKEKKWNQLSSREKLAIFRNLNIKEEINKFELNFGYGDVTNKFVFNPEGTLTVQSLSRPGILQTKNDPGFVENLSQNLHYLMCKKRNLALRDLIENKIVPESYKGKILRLKNEWESHGTINKNIKILTEFIMDSGYFDNTRERISGLIQKNNQDPNDYTSFTNFLRGKNSKRFIKEVMQTMISKFDKDTTQTTVLKDRSYNDSIYYRTNENSPYERIDSFMAKEDRKETLRILRKQSKGFKDTFSTKRKILNILSEYEIPNFGTQPFKLKNIILGGSVDDNYTRDRDKIINRLKRAFLRIAPSPRFRRDSIFLNENEKKNGVEFLPKPSAVMKKNGNMSYKT